MATDEANRLLARIIERRRQRTYRLAIERCIISPEQRDALMRLHRELDAETEADWRAER